MNKRSAFRRPRRASVRTGLRAFTLIELLVVVTIIALLAGLLMASLSGVSENGRRVTCSNNQKQLFNAMALYAAENDGYLPSATWGDVFDGDGWLYGSGKINLTPLQKSYESGAVWKYIKDTRVYFCPGDTDGKIRQGRRQKLSSYSVNGAVNYRTDKHAPPTYRLANFHPNAIIMWEQEEGPNSPLKSFYFNDGGNEPDEVFYPASSAQRKTYESVNRHKNGTPIVCADGHSEWVEINDMLKLEKKEKQIWNAGNPEQKRLRTWCEPKW